MSDSIKKVKIEKVDPVGTTYDKKEVIYDILTGDEEKPLQYRLLITIGDYQYMFTPNGSLIGIPKNGEDIPNKS